MSEVKHPADELGKALARANGILALLSGCYEKSSANFETGQSFVFESITAVETMLQTATDALARLYQTCDLSVIRGSVEAQAPVELPAVSQEQALPPLQFVGQQAPEVQRPSQLAFDPQDLGGSYLGFFGPPPEAVSTLSDRLDNILVNMPAKTRSRQSEVFEKPAENYEELLQKITALADVAAFQAHQSHQDGNLLPALEGLRADLIKLRSVA